MAHDPEIAFANTSDEELSALMHQNELYRVDTDELLDPDEIDWEKAPFSRPKIPLPGIAPSATLSFFEGLSEFEELVVVITERAGTADPYVIWLGTAEQAEAVFETA